MKARKLSLVLAVVAAATLTACGGGGGGPAQNAADALIKGATDLFNTGVGAITGGANGYNPGPSNVSTIVNAVPAASYAAGSEEMAAFTLLNNERSRCGFGKLTQNSQVDAAARAHADYQIRNNIDSHVENKLVYPNGFTGALDVDRLAAQGYTGIGLATDEYTFWEGSNSKTGLGAKTVRQLLSAPYHLKGLTSGFRDFGIAVRSNADMGVANKAVFVQFNLAFKSAAGAQLIPSSDLLTYPCEGVTGVIPALNDEAPNPVPGRNLRTNPLGPAVYITARPGQVLSITGASMFRVSNGSNVLLRAPITKGTDPHKGCTVGCFQSHEGYVIPDAPLAANTVYSVTVNGMHDGVSFTRTFRFTTGA